MASRISTKDRLTKAGHAMNKGVADLKKKPYVKVGFPQKTFDKKKSQGSSGGGNMTVGEVAVANEFGTDTIPERSFIRSTYDNQNSKWRKQTDQLKINVLLRKTSTHKALGLIGETIKKDDQATIRRGGEPFVKNAPATIRAKTRAGKVGDRPLIDTGQMLNSVTYERHNTN